MTMTKHTPGRWSRNIKPISKYPVIFAGRNTHIARVVTDAISLEEAEANAGLIVAAPDMHAFIQDLRAWTKRPGTVAEYAALMDRADAIAKATGEA